MSFLLLVFYFDFGLWSVLSWWMKVFVNKKTSCFFSKPSVLRFKKMLLVF